MRRLRWPSWHAPLPLLGKDLVEQAARRRTYVARVVYATLLFTVFCMANYQQFSRGDPTTDAALGRGKEMFEALVFIQFAGIVLFLPAMMSGALTYEKERGSLGLLLLTSLKPREILLQKYLGRLVSMLSILLLGLPLLALMAGVFNGRNEEAAFALVPLSLYGRGVAGDAEGQTWRIALILASAVGFLGLARAFLVSRAFLESKNRLLGFFRLLDRFYERVNKALGGFRLGRPRESLPEDEPVAWREVARRSLGKPLYRFRILVALEVPTLFIASAAMLRAEAREMRWALSLVFYGIAILAAIVVSVTSANAVASERTSQTLDVLLTTPIRGRDILRQKLRGVRRLRGVLPIPLATILLVIAWWSESWRRYHDHNASYYHYEMPHLLHLGLMFLAAVIFLTLFTWMGLWFALRTRSRLRAIMATLATLVGWNAAPPLLFYLLAESIGYSSMQHHVWLILLSPAVCIGVLEHGPSGVLGQVIGFLAIYAVLNAIAWAVCLARADRYLGRASGQAHKPLSAGSVCGILTPEEAPPSDRG